MIKQDCSISHFTRLDNISIYLKELILQWRTNIVCCPVVVVAWYSCRPGEDCWTSDFWLIWLHAIIVFFPKTTFRIQILFTSKLGEANILWWKVWDGWKSWLMSHRARMKVVVYRQRPVWASPCQCVAAGRVQTQPSLQWAVGGGTWSHRVTPTLVTLVTLTVLCTSNK